jgi:hypothetical protein
VTPPGNPKSPITSITTTLTGPRRPLNQRAPTAPEPATPLRQLDVARSTRCDGLIHEYRNAA